MNVPCRVSHDLRSHMTDLANATQPAFSEWDDDLMKDLFGDRLWQAAQNLLITQSEVARIADSFGQDAVNAKVLLERIQRELKAFREASVDAWREGL